VNGNRKGRKGATWGGGTQAGGEKEKESLIIAGLAEAMRGGLITGTLRARRVEGKMRRRLVSDG